MNKSNSIAELAKALTLAQAEMKPVAMNSVNPFLKNKFADLGAMIEASRPVLAKHSLSLSQFPTAGERGDIGITTILMHASGEWLENTITLPVEIEKGKSQAQVAGSLITYLRRYSWAAVLGLYAEEDTDGSQASQRQAAVKKEAAQSAAPARASVSGNGGETVKPATVHVKHAAKEFRQACKEFVTRHPAYQTEIKGQPSGEPNMFHILGAAGKLGFAEINDGNYQAVVEAVARRAVAQAAPPEEIPL